MTELEGLIRLWERILFDFRPLMEPSMCSSIEATIQYLKELKQRKGEQK